MYVMIHLSKLLIIFTDTSPKNTPTNTPTIYTLPTNTSPVGAIIGGTIGGSILLCILFTAMLLCICCCMSAGKKSSYNQNIGLASTAVHRPQTADARLVAETKFTQQQVPPPAYPAAGYIQQPLPPPGPPLGPPPAYPATEYVLVDNPAPYFPQQPFLMPHPTAQMGYPPVGYPVQDYGYPAPVGYPVQSYGYPQMEAQPNTDEHEYY